jgi:hypothetical protein
MLAYFSTWLIKQKIINYMKYLSHLAYETFLGIQYAIYKMKIFFCHECMWIWKFQLKNLLLDLDEISCGKSTLNVAG